MNKLIEPCIELAERAGDAIMAIYKKGDIGQQEKSDNTPVTKADLAANDVLVAGLKALSARYPNYVGRNTYTCTRRQTGLAALLVARSDGWYWRIYFRKWRLCSKHCID